MADKGPEEPVRCHFADLTLDAGQRLVTRGEDTLDISGLTFDLLQAIVEAAPNIVSYDDLAEKVWKGRPASPETITQRTMMLRQALGDSADNPKYIEVVRGQGIRLVPPLESSNPVVPDKTLKTGSRLPLAAGLVVLAIAVFYAGTNLNEQGAAEPVIERPQVRRTQTDLGELNTLGPAGTAVELALSPDGSQLAYVINQPGVGNTLYLRSLDDFEAKPIVEAANGRHPYFSQDGEWLIFESSSTELSKISVHGGSPVPITGGQHARIFGSTFARNGDIIFATNSDVGNWLSGVLKRVSPAGGDLRTMTHPPEGMSYTWPQMLPDGNSLMVTSRTNNSPATRANVTLLSVDSGEQTVLLNSAYNARYSPTGHLLFGRDGDLWAVPFDAQTLEITGDEQPVLYDIHGQSQLGQLIYDFSDEGHLVYVRGGDVAGSGGLLRELVWLDESGQVEPLGMDPMSLIGPSLSPDGSKVAMVVGDSTGGSDIWVFDRERRTLSRLTFHESGDYYPMWSPDGEEVWFRSLRESGTVHARAADGTGEAKAIWKDTSLPNIQAISPDGRYFILSDTGQGESDIFVYDTKLGEPAKPLISTPFDEGAAQVSPDGRYIAYVSDETGQNEVYVRPFPNVEGGKWQISNEGATEPRWSTDGTRLFLRQPGTGRFYTAAVSTGPVFRYDTPHHLLDSNIVGIGWPRYAISPIDDRLLILRNANTGNSEGIPSEGNTSLAFVENWFEELKRIKPREN